MMLSDHSDAWETTVMSRTPVSVLSIGCWESLAGGFPPAEDITESAGGRGQEGEWKGSWMKR
jgi:hypothetical protein